VLTKLPGGNWLAKRIRRSQEAMRVIGLHGRMFVLPGIAALGAGRLLGNCSSREGG
jgi:hypothetical protein